MTKVSNCCLIYTTASLAFLARLVVFFQRPFWSSLELRTRRDVGMSRSSASAGEVPRTLGGSSARVLECLRRPGDVRARGDLRESGPERTLATRTRRDTARGTNPTTIGCRGKKQSASRSFERLALGRTFASYRSVRMGSSRGCPTHSRPLSVLLCLYAVQASRRVPVCRPMSSRRQLFLSLEKRGSPPGLCASGVRFLMN